jgi:hypothetical protein
MPSSHEQEGTINFDCATQAQLESLELKAHNDSFTGSMHTVSIFVQNDKEDIGNEVRVYQSGELHLRNRTVVNMH